jgi:hypothetical protein
MKQIKSKVMRTRSEKRRSVKTPTMAITNRIAAGSKVTFTSFSEDHRGAALSVAIESVCAAIADSVVAVSIRGEGLA